jgi:hypothetical protein
MNPFEILTIYCFCFKKAYCGCFPYADKKTIIVAGITNFKPVSS